MPRNAIPRTDLSIGALSQQIGCHVETIRYYEKIGLLPVPPRTRGGHRVYTDEHRKRLSFIRYGRELGFTLDKIRNLLGLIDNDHACREVQAVALARLEDVRRKIADLQRAQQILTEMVALCKGGDAPGCPVIDILSA